MTLFEQISDKTREKLRSQDGLSSAMLQLNHLSEVPDLHSDDRERPRAHSTKKSKALERQNAHSNVQLDYVKSDQSAINLSTLRDIMAVRSNNETREGGGSKISKLSKKNALSRQGNPAYREKPSLKSDGGHYKSKFVALNKSGKALKNELDVSYRSINSSEKGEKSQTDLRA